MSIAFPADDSGDGRAEVNDTMPYKDEGAQLLAAYREGNADAFSQLVERYQASGLTIANRILGNAHTAEDAMQHAWLNIFNNQQTSFHTTRAFFPWFASVVRNCCIDMKRQQNRGIRSISGHVHAEAIILLPDAARPVGDELTECEAVNYALAKMDPWQADILKSKYCEGDSTNDIARASGLAEATMRYHLVNAREGFQRLYAVSTMQEDSPHFTARRKSA